MNVNFQRMLLKQPPQECTESLFDFIRHEVWFFTCLYDRRFPDRREINDLLAQGHGSDGWIVMKWTPFQITEAEYQELGRDFARFLEDNSRESMTYQVGQQKGRGS